MALPRCDMRIGLVIVGLVLIILGAVLLFVPLEPQTNQVVSTSSDTPYYEGTVSGFSLTGSIPISVSWNASATVQVIAGACTATCTNESQVSSITTETGMSGSFTLSQPNGGSILMGAIGPLGGSPASVTFKITTALTTVGTILVPVGIIVLILGVVLKSQKQKMAAMAPPASPPTPPPAAPPASPPPPGAPPM